MKIFLIPPIALTGVTVNMAPTFAQKIRETTAGKSLDRLMIFPRRATVPANYAKVYHSPQIIPLSLVRRLFFELVENRRLRPSQKGTITLWQKSCGPVRFGLK